MSITSKTTMNEGLLNILDDYFGNNLVAFLIDDSSGTLDKTSSMSTVSSLEIPSGNGYSRKTVILNGASMVGSQASTTSQELDWTASGGTIPNFSHICFVIKGSTTVGDSTGVIDRVRSFALEN